MRVLQLTQRYPPAIGGVETHVAHLAAELPRAGVRVEVFTSDLRRDIPFDRFRRPLPNGSSAVHRFRAVRAADLPHALGNIVPGMVPAVLGGRWDVIHAHAYGYFPTFAGTLGGLLDRGSLVITAHADPGRPSPEKRWFDRVVPPLSLRRAARVIALTPSETEYLVTLGVERERIRVIPNGVDLAEFPAPREGGGEDGHVTVLFAGRCYPDQKGLEVLLRAMALVRSEGLRLRIVGEDWGGHAVVSSLSRELNLGDRVTLVGRVDRPELLREFGRADVFVLPSLFDSFPVALLEAMAAGLPVLATRVGGVPDVVEDGRTGMLVPPGDAASLARALDALAADESLRRSMGRAGRERSAAYAWDAIVRSIKRVYDEAVSERAS